MQKVLYRFVRQVASIAQKYSAAGLNKISNPIGNGFAGWKHVVLHYARIHMNASYAEVVDWVEEMDRIRALLDIEFGHFPHPSTLCRSFKRSPMSVWRGLLSGSAALLKQSGHAAIDATFFTRRRASPHYLRRIDRSVETLKVTILVDTAEQAVLDIHCSARWPNDAKIGPKLVRRNIDKLESLAADKGFDSKKFRRELREYGVRPLIKHRIYNTIDHAHNARIDDEMYNQRALTETVNSSIKRSLREAVDSRLWFCQFRELVLTASVYNVERALKQENHQT